MNNLKISVRIYLALGTAIVVGALGCITAVQFWSASSDQNEVARTALEDAMLASDLRVHVDMLHTQWATLVSSLSNEPGRFDKRRNAFRVTKREVQKELVLLDKKLSTTNVATKAAPFTRKTEKLLATYEQALGRLGDGSGLKASIATVAKLNTEDRNALTNLSNMLRDWAGSEATQAAEAADSRQSSLMLLLSVGFPMCIFLSLWVARSVTAPLAQLVDLAQHITDERGDANFQFPPGTELGIMADALRSLRDYVAEVTNAIEALGRGELSARVTPRGSHDALAHNVTRTTDSLKALTEQLGHLVTAAREGDLSARADASQQHGAFRKVLNQMNELMDSIAAPIHEASDVLEQVADRNLTVRMNGQFSGEYAKVKSALNSALDKIEGALGRVWVAVDQVSTSSGEIREGSDSLARDTSTQAGSLEEVTASLGDINEMTTQSAESAAQARDLADETRQAALGGLESMKVLSETIEGIKSAADQTGRIVKTIDEIAFQTNLLSLNAAVEAARAGDAGRGFAVVADEVRGLAMRSAEAARTTAELIEGSVRTADSGVTSNKQVFTRFQEIGDKVERVVAAMAQIASASERQSEGVNQVDEALQNMSRMTQRNAATTEESAANAKELESQARAMRGLVSQFKLKESAQSSFTMMDDSLMDGGAANANMDASDEARALIPLDDDILGSF